MVVVMMVLSLLVVVSCGRSQPVSLPDTSKAGTTSHETELPVIGEAPDFELTNQDEARMRLSELRGKVVLMNFIYTSCPGPCHLQNFGLLIVRNGLDEASRQELVLASISFDPEVDTPQVLKEYARARGFDIPGWHFLTGSQEEIAKVTAEYGVVYELVPPETYVHPLCLSLRRG